MNQFSHIEEIEQHYKDTLNPDIGHAAYQRLDKSVTVVSHLVRFLLLVYMLRNLIYWKKLYIPN